MAIDQSIEKRFRQLRIWNIAVGLILAVQAIMIAVLTNSFSLPVTATFMKGPPGVGHPSFTTCLISPPAGACLLS